MSFSYMRNFKLGASTPAPPPQTQMTIPGLGFSLNLAPQTPIVIPGFENFGGPQDSPIPGEGQINGFTAIGDGFKTVAEDVANKQKIRNQYGDPLPLEELGRRFQVSAEDMGDNYLLNILRQLQYYPEREYLLRNRINENRDNRNRSSSGNSVLDALSNAFDPQKNGAADAFDPNKNGAADAFDPNKNGFNDSLNDTKEKFENAFDPTKNGVNALAVDWGKGLESFKNSMEQSFKDFGLKTKDTFVDTGNKIKDGFLNEALPVLEGIGQGILETVIGGGSPPPNYPTAPKAPPRSVSAIGGLFPFLMIGGGVLAVLVLLKKRS